MPVDAAGIDVVEIVFDEAEDVDDPVGFGAWVLVEGLVVVSGVSLTSVVGFAGSSS